MHQDETKNLFDVFVIGGGINGCGIARDAAGRGLSVCLAEKDDLASATSSASTKLFHGGLRYLEFFEFRLVREALREREILLRNMPHISAPMRFVLPLSRDMRFEGGTPSSRLLGAFMPWLKGRRPDWVIRLGLFLYDHMGGRKILPATQRLPLEGTAEGAALKPVFRQAFEYSDCVVDDARLVALNARDAAERGAQIMTRCTVVGARRSGGIWQVETETAEGERSTIHAKALVNAGGPWVADLLDGVITTEMRGSIRLVRGSHIVTRKLYDHEKSYFFQGSDGRIIFAIPYQDGFTMLGTTDADHSDPDTAAHCTEQERRYLLDFANQYFATALSDDDIVWSFSGVRPLKDDGQSSASAATRDYELHLEGEVAPLLTVFGGKITSYRKVSQSACDKLGLFFEKAGGAWTEVAPLPGGDFAHDGFADQVARLQAGFAFLDLSTAHRLVRAYGTDASVMLDGAKSEADLGAHFEAGLTAREVDWMVKHEFAQTVEDILWRRSKLGLRFGESGKAALEQYLAAR